MFVKRNEMAVKDGIVGCGEAQAVFGIEAVFLILGPRADMAGAKDIRHGKTRHATFAADDWIRVVFRQDRAEHVERTDIGRGLSASVRVRGEDEICKQLPKHFLDIIPKIAHIEHGFM